jgi:hypothetical protein
MAENKKTISYEIDDHHDRAPSSGSTKYTISSVDIDLLRVSGVAEDIVSIDEEIEAEERFEEILRTIPKYGKNDITLS